MATVSDKPVYGLGGSSSDDVFAVGAMGYIYHFDGATWSPMVSGTTQNLRDVWASSPSDVFAVGGLTLHYDGAVWTEMSLFNADGVWGSSPTNVFATSSGRVKHYNGTSWTQSCSWVGQALKGVFGVSECDVFAVGGGGTIVHYSGQAPVPVLISHFGASVKEKAIELRWEITSDEPVVGFRIYRSDDRSPIERRLDEGWAIEPSARRYTDTTVQHGVRYRYTLGVVDADGSEVRSQTTEIKSPAYSMALFQNQPNPFNPTTRVRFSVPKKTYVTLQIFNLEGKLITQLISKVVDTGLQELEWDGRDERGHPMASGVYFYRLEAGGIILSRKMILIK
jgi:hypothetical protein